MLTIKYRIYLVAALLIALNSCKKASPGSSSSIKWNDTLVAYAPVPVTKTISKRVFAHILPWFETPVTNSGLWGQHWTGTNPGGQPLDNPSQGQIASHYNPLIGPYASGDTTVIDDQLLLMKLSGIDGVFIDWPGTLNYSDFSTNLANSNAIISRVGKLGLKYAIVYEDHNLQFSNTPIAQAEADMAYMQANYFSDPNYEKIGTAPVLLDFGPQQGGLTTPADWTSAFSVVSTKPALFTLQYQSSEAGTNATGEFTWVEQDTLTGLRKFYNRNYSGTEISAAFPGYNSIYAEEGANAGPTWVVTPSLSIFQQSVALALQQANNNYLQLVTWNDYGEGTMIEPTTQFQYDFLTDLQQQLSVQSSLSVSDLQAVNKLYTARVSNISNADKLTELNQVFYYMASLQMDNAKALLQDF